MKKLRMPTLVLALSLVLGALGFGAAPAAARGAPDSFADLAAQLSPTVVNVSTTQTLKRTATGPQQALPPGSPLDDFFKDFLDQNPNTPRRVTSLGSGFIIDASGLIVTNNHVIDGADDITVILNDGTNLPATLVGRDQQTDLALLRVKPKAPLPVAKFGDSDKERVGDWVIAIGNPFGLGGSVTAGIVSARNRDINSGPYDDFIQTDAPINRGNSGGPLFNMDGEVIGVNSAIYSPSGGSVGIGFAIPSNMTRTVIAQLRSSGEVRRGWLGVRIQQVTDEIAESLGIPSPKGALVAGVTAGGPAAKAGLQTGDLILSFDGKNVPDNRTLPRIVADTPVGKTVQVGVLRKGKNQTFSVVLGRLPDSDEAAASKTTTKPPVTTPQKPLSSLGMTLAALTPQLRAQYKIDAKVQGVVVTDVDGDGPAAEKNLRAGDVIVQVAQAAVKTPDEVNAKVEAERKAGKTAVLLEVNHGGDVAFVGVKIRK